MYCTTCGKQLHDNAVICVNCGCATEKFSNNIKTDTKYSFGWWILGFFMPSVGLILFLTLKNYLPQCAKKAGWGALISVIVSAVFIFIVFAYYVFILLLIIIATYA